MSSRNSALPLWAGGEWPAIAADGYRMMADGAAVIWMRSLQMMTGGPAAVPEAVLMVSEKLQASTDLMMKFMTSPATSAEEAARRTVSHYGRKVTANRKRLSKVGT